MTAQRKDINIMYDFSPWGSVPRFQRHAGFTQGVAEETAADASNMQHVLQNCTNNAFFFRGTYIYRMFVCDHTHTHFST